MEIRVELGEDVIEIKKAKICCIKNCKEYATENRCTLAMCKKHNDAMRD